MRPLACLADASSRIIFTFTLALTLFLVLAPSSFGAGSSPDVARFRNPATDEEPCAICPPGGVAEGEPPCMDDYVDEYNSGCCCLEMNWTPIIPVTEGCATMCGRSCTFLHHGLSYRDTDWFACEAAGGPVTVECQADFPVEMLLFDPADCDSLIFDHVVIGERCETVQLTHSMPANSTFWIWVGPSEFNGIPERPYLLNVCGITGSAATIQDPVESDDFEKTTWGRLKKAFGTGNR